MIEVSEEQTKIIQSGMHLQCKEAIELMGLETLAVLERNGVPFELEQQLHEPYENLMNNMAMYADWIENPENRVEGIATLLEYQEYLLSDDNPKFQEFMINEALNNENISIHRVTEHT